MSSTLVDLRLCRYERHKTIKGDEQGIRICTELAIKGKRHQLERQSKKGQIFENETEGLEETMKRMKKGGKKPP